MRAAIASVSEVAPRTIPSAERASRRFVVFVKLPLWPSAIVRARPCWTSGCTLAHAFAPVVE